MSVSAWSVVQSGESYKIDDVKHIEELNDIDNIEDIDETYRLSGSELTREQKQRIMNEKSVTTTDEIEIHDGKVALMTDNSLYIADVEQSYPNAFAGIIITLISFFLHIYTLYILSPEDLFLYPVAILCSGCSIISILSMTVIFFSVTF
jgi:hypothetical protein